MTDLVVEKKYTGDTKILGSKPSDKQVNKILRSKYKLQSTPRVEGLKSKLKNIEKK